jgi:hypothetical protein
MKKIDKFLDAEWKQNVFLLLIISLAYLPVLVAPKTVNHDAQLIIPLLKSVHSFSDYYEMLFSFNTYDVQPIRDLTFFVDIFFFKHFHFNTFIVQNIFFWFLACIAVKKSLSLVFSSFSRNECFYLACLFAIYPLFCGTLCWGIARKHILSFLFIMLSTLFLFRILKKTGVKKYEVILINVFYILSIFSQPITLLWPFWALTYVFINFREKIKTIAFHLIPSLIFFIVGAYVNSLYYEQSSVFKIHYESKTSDAFNFSDKVLGLGHYIYQLFLPFWQATHYQLGHWSVWVGILLMGFFSLIYLSLKLNKSWLLSWFGFVMFPLAVILSNPHILSDNYLLTPSFGVLVLVVTLLNKNENFKNKFFNFGFFPLLLVWSSYTFQEAKLWTDPLKYSEIRNFERRPNCESAINMARKFYALKGYIPEKAKDYLENFECSHPVVSVAASAVSYIYLQTYINYYEKEISLENKIRVLEKLSHIYYFSKLVLAVVYIESKREREGEVLINEVYKDYDKISWVDYYDLILAKKLEPYCKRTNNFDCLRITSHFSQVPDIPYY